MISDIVMNVLPYNNMKHQNSLVLLVLLVVIYGGCGAASMKNGVGWILQQFDLLLILVKTVA
ncbi:hypothetical protein KY290_030806 [Solanum tuberosum]|uniref:Uncharacterized protein n=1 Tax=Solanum tuberosum TaxID=4113 RepID=A0ABQ7U7R0_SOLTU|nr:hypothetical protein KY290_030806 [Solanum tuberosum]